MIVVRCRVFILVQNVNKFLFRRLSYPCLEEGRRIASGFKRDVKKLGRERENERKETMKERTKGREDKNRKR